MARPEIPDRQIRRIRDLHIEARGYKSKSTQEALATLIDNAEKAIDAGLHLDSSIFTASLPDGLRFAVNSVQPEFVKSDSSYQRQHEESDEVDILKMVTQDSETTLTQIEIFYPAKDRQSYRVDFSYRNSDGEMTLGARLRSRQDGFLSVKYRDLDTQELKDTTLNPNDAAERIRPPLTTFGYQAIEAF